MEHGQSFSQDLNTDEILSDPNFMKAEQIANMDDTEIANFTKAKMPKKKSKAGIILLALFLLGVAGFFAAEYFGIEDYIKASNFAPTAEVSELMSDLSLTEKGDRIFRATSPSLENKTVFNDVCQTFEVDAPVLGCYLSGDDKLYVYNVETDDLPGIIQSTAAHELLHAVWVRLPSWEKTELAAELQKIYNALPADSDIREVMKNYPAESFFDELHSYIGTEIAELPESLENHYAEIFKNQDNIVKYYANYSEIYLKLKNKLTELMAKIDTEKAEIDKENNAIESAIESLNARIDAFNIVIDSGNYDYDSAVRQQTALNRESEELSRRLDALNARIDEFNKMVDEYNSNVLRNQYIEKAINSKSDSLNLVEKK